MSVVLRCNNDALGQRSRACPSTSNVFISSHLSDLELSGDTGELQGWPHHLVYATVHRCSQLHGVVSEVVDACRAQLTVSDN